LFWQRRAAPGPRSSPPPPRNEVGHPSRSSPPPPRNEVGHPSRSSPPPPRNEVGHPSPTSKRGGPPVTIIASPTSKRGGPPVHRLPHLETRWATRPTAYAVGYRVSPLQRLNVFKLLTLNAAPGPRSSPPPPPEEVGHPPRGGGPPAFLRPSGAVPPFDIAYHGFRFARLSPGYAAPVATPPGPSEAEPTPTPTRPSPWIFKARTRIIDDGRVLAAAWVSRR